MTTANEPKLAKTLLKQYDRPASLDNPRSPHRPAAGNFEKYAWLFMRFSCVALLVLVFGHVFIMLALDSREKRRERKAGRADPVNVARAAAFGFMVLAVVVYSGPEPQTFVYFHF